MHHLSRYVASAAAIAAAMIVAAPARADDDGRRGEANRYVQTNLTSDLPGVAPNTDPVLQNAWGVTFTPAASPFWISDNATGCSTLYDGTGVPQPATPLRVKLPLPGGMVPPTACMHNDPKNPLNPTPAVPTGLVWNPTTMPATAFLVPGTMLPATFIWDTEDGTIAAWTGGLTPPDQAVLAADNSPGAVYKGLVFGVNAKGVFLFATNFRTGTVDVFDHTYTKVTTSGGFADPKIPAGFAPFGIQNINGDLFVTYAKQNAAKHDDVAGRGNGFVDVFDTDGNLLQRFASRGSLNSPWGVARASFAFGKFSGDILVGNFGDGRINAFDSDGNFLGTLRDAKGKPISIDGLWTITLGGGKNSSSDTLYFTAGPNGETDGLFGTITPVSAPE
ncbi:MAG TPA: TIGR03118 family protein [Stellaceae bacterium]|nr:TIGR03118 family protein [Stellaceae bacterium]